MTASDLLESIGEKLGSTATVKTVYGEPIQANGKTVVPIAKVAYGFGAGFGSGHGKHNGHEIAAHENGSHDAAHEARHGEGGGGGGGVRAFPAGALEITDSGTRFVPFVDLRPLAAAFAVGALMSLLLFRRRGA
jgi:uncharacterized spore protein YtfJ